MTKPSDASENDINKALFANLVMMFSTSALQHLGQMADPESKTVEVNLDGAQMNIDMLDMLEKKTKGNLGEDEAHMLQEALSTLKIAYVQTKNAAASSPQDSAAPAETPEPAPSEAVASDDEPIISSDATDKKEPKFHKKYD